MSEHPGLSTPMIFERPPIPSLSRSKLLRIADAGERAVDCLRKLHAEGSNIVIEALRGSSDFTEWEHYPPQDVHDPKSHAQYYFHAHAPDDRDSPDYGHFHTFMRARGMPSGVRPVFQGQVVQTDNNDDLSHLIAISMTRAGMPERLFTTNRWVTGETWYCAADVIAMLDHFVVELDRPSPLLNQWLTAMLVLFRPDIEDLLFERDHAVSRWRTNYPDRDVFEDRGLEITSSKQISLFDHIEWLDGQLDTTITA